MNDLSRIELASGMPPSVAQAFARAQMIFTERQVSNAINRLAVELTICLQDQNPIFLSVMQGGLYLSGQLMQRVVFPLQLGYVDFVINATENAKDEPKINARHPTLDGRVVVTINDVLDEDSNITGLNSWVLAAGASTAYSVVLGDRQNTELNADFSALVFPDQPVFGCGMDIQGYARNLSAIYALP
jgi:hypoxanthine phosphoribosyltransferase